MKLKKLLLILIILLTPFNVLAIPEYVIPGGENIGIEIDFKGVLVVGFYKVNNKYNNKTIKIGDYITKVNNIEINSINDLLNNLNEENNKLTIIRDNKELLINFKLIKDNNTYKSGLYVKDKISGIGTLTYIDPENNIYGALGHEIIESNSKEIVSVNNGYIFESNIKSIDKSKDGIPGTKNASLITNNRFGSINKNSIYGIFGKYNSNINKDKIYVGNIDDLHLGHATIYTVLNNKDIGEFSINITKIDKSAKVKNIYFEIDDDTLLNTTGGIVQGMSGSPIIQDNKLYGAITHVVIEHVNTGYGISIDKMLNNEE